MIINAKKEDFFAVNIIQKEVPIHICTGALYTANVVLLPASCIVRQGKNGKQVSKPNIRAGTREIFGEENLKGIEVWYHLYYCNALLQFAIRILVEFFILEVTTNISILDNF